MKKLLVANLIVSIVTLVVCLRCLRTCSTCEYKPCPIEMGHNQVEIDHLKACCDNLNCRLKECECRPTCECKPVAPAHAPVPAPVKPAPSLKPAPKPPAIPQCR